MPPSEATILCQTPTPGKQGTRIARWKYDAVRAALRRAIGRARAGVPFRELPPLVEQFLEPEARRNLGSVAWYTVTVKLHMETLGEIERVPGSTPQRLRLRATAR